MKICEKSFDSNAFVCCVLIDQDEKLERIACNVGWVCVVGHADEDEFLVYLSDYPCVS